MSYLFRLWKFRAYSQSRINQYYVRRAANYQATDHFVQLFGYKPRVELRRRLIEHSRLKAGDRVLDIGCGSGSNFPFIMEKIGETGELVGVDFSEAMLAQAQVMIEEHGWKNVHLVHEDAARLNMGEDYDVVLSALAMVVIPEWEPALERAFEHVRPGGNFAIADLCASQRWYMLPVNVFMDVFDSLLITDTTRRPWEVMKSWVEDYRREDWLLGYMYVASGHRPEKR
ncbi:MAG TPA: class I SAM-dependent methyltransferase [Aggregatilineales bacterium]|nr:class I SAM-dependent methyltransferase [Aggregatilineales bacterium]